MRRPASSISATLRGLFIAGALLSTGCSPWPTSRHAAVRPEPYAWVRLVGKAPSADHYQIAGTVEGVAPETDFVAAARSARADIRYKAAQMGAALVRIDQVKLPPSHKRGKPNVLLIGRAYRFVDPAAPGSHGTRKGRNAAAAPVSTNI